MLLTHPGAEAASRPNVVPPLRLRFSVLAGMVLAVAATARGDPRVTVNARAREDYLAQHHHEAGAAAETYVLLQGSYFEGQTVDHSLERMPFRRIAEYLGVQLARQHYLPAADIKEAQLLIVVHWGATTPRFSQQEALGGTSLTTPGPGAADVAAFAQANPTGVVEGLPPAPDTTMTADANDLPGVADRLIGNVSAGNAAVLLGYQEEIHRLGKRAYADEQNDIINFHLTNERYFITVMAYDLHQLQSGGARQRPVWTLHLNISSPGNNFQTALERLSTVAGQFAGQTTDGLQNVRPETHEGNVRLAPLIILGEVKAGSK